MGSQLNNNVSKGRSVRESELAVNKQQLLVKSPENNFIFAPAFCVIVCLMKASKIFGKIAILKIWDLASLKVSKLTPVN